MQFDADATTLLAKILVPLQALSKSWCRYKHYQNPSAYEGTIKIAAPLCHYLSSGAATLLFK